MSEVLIRHQFDWTCTSPSTAVISAIAVVENADPLTLDFVLYDYIDPQALDRLVTDDRHVSLSFLLDDYRVRIDGSELVVDYRQR